MVWFFVFAIIRTLLRKKKNVEGETINYNDLRDLSTNVRTSFESDKDCQR